MSCTVSREELALYAEGDQLDTRGTATARHLAACEDCRQFLEQMQARQALLKSLRRETMNSSDCSGMRREVMSIINRPAGRGGWVVRLERALMLGVRRPSYAVATLALIGIVSVSVLAQMRHVPPDTANAPAAVFDESGALLRPDNYQRWIRVSSIGRISREAAASVYIEPSSYQQYVRTGRFPDGTLMVWESTQEAPHGSDRTRLDTPLLLASVRDSARFEGGWGFFDFTGDGRSPVDKAAALPESAGCRTCHRREAETDHVFTQFYPALNMAGRSAQVEAPLKLPVAHS